MNKSRRQRCLYSHAHSTRLNHESLESRYMLAAVPFSEQQIIDDADADGAATIVTADIDGDSDPDVVVGSYRDSRISWFENLGGGMFEQHIVSTESTGVRSVVVADFDGDGDIDIAAAAYEADRVHWYKNNDGNGNFDAAITLATGMTGVRSLDVGDVDNDGDIDIISAAWLSSDVAVHENLGNGSFTLKRSISDGSQRPRSARLADIDGDGNLDVAVAWRFDDEISWYSGNGNATFDAPQRVETTINGPESLELGDMDGDGDEDMVVAVYWGAQVVWYENDGNGTFISETELSGGSLRGQTISLSDLDGDGDMDVLAGSYLFGDDSEGDKVAWFENTDGKGSFSRENFIAFGTTQGVEAVIADDLDGDGDPDVMAVSLIDNKISWYENDGSARFGPQLSIASDAAGAASIDIADFDGDGDPDVLAGSFFDNGLAWYENQGDGSFGKERVIAFSTASWLQGVRAGDIDGDGDIDALSASFDDDKIAWYENLDGKGNFGEQKIIGLANGAVDVNVADLDGDGDTDVLAASTADATVAWYENTDGKGTFSTAKRLSTRAFGAEWVTSVDLDGDGDLDVLSAAYGDAEGTIDARVAWYENLDGKGDFSAANIVHLGGVADAVEAGDLDGDGDLDLAITLYDNGSLVWYENQNGQFGDLQVIAQGLSFVEALSLADVDGNGTLDLLSAASDAIYWYERVGDNFEEHFISSAVLGTLAVKTADFDLDGDLDVISASIDDNKIAWYENLSIDGSARGDLNQDGTVNAADIDHLCAAIQSGNTDQDLTSDGQIDQADLNELVFNILNSTIGDANLDGLFNSNDLVLIFQAGEYEDGVAGNSGWAEGDWTCDSEFGSSDLVAAFNVGDFDPNAVAAAKVRENSNQIAAAIVGDDVDTDKKSRRR